MKNIGYIVSKRKIRDLMEGIRVVDNISLTDPNLPLLIVGLNEAKENVSDFSILRKKVNDNTFWTFGKTEKRSDYEEDLDKFYSLIINNIINKIKYYYVNILLLKYSKAKKLLEIINSSEEKYIYICNNMIYIYYNGYVLGISLDILNYTKIKKEKVFSLITRNNKNHVVFNDYFLTWKIKNYIGTKKYLIPYMFSLQEQN